MTVSRLRQHPGRQPRVCADSTEATYHSCGSTITWRAPRLAVLTGKADLPKVSNESGADTPAAGGRCPLLTHSGRSKGPLESDPPRPGRVPQAHHAPNGFWRTFSARRARWLDGEGACRPGRRGGASEAITLYPSEHDVVTHIAVGLAAVEGGLARGTHSAGTLAVLRVERPAEV